MSGKNPSDVNRRVMGMENTDAGPSQSQHPGTDNGKLLVGMMTEHARLQSLRRRDQNKMQDAEKTLNEIEITAAKGLALSGEMKSVTDETTIAIKALLRSRHIACSL